MGLQRKAAALPLAEEPLWVLASHSGFTWQLRERADAAGVLLVMPADMFT